MKQIIIDSDEEIMKGNFGINPTVTKSPDFDACEFCPFHDVCFIDKKKRIVENLSKNSTDSEEDEEKQGKGESYHGS